MRWPTPARGLRQGALDAPAAGRPGCGTARNGFEVELVDGEEGVSPGQACVFYDAGEGQARVLGGGFIKSAVAAADRQRRREMQVAARGDARLSAAHEGDIDKSSVERAYARWAPVYDVVFGAVFDARPRAPRSRRPSACGPRRAHPRSRRRHRHLAARLRAQATASSASISPSRCCARRTSASPSTDLTNVEALAVMDAERLALPDAVFDVVVAQYVITAVPNPEATLDEFARVIKPGRRDRPGQSHRRRERARAACSSCALRRSRAGSAGGRNFRLAGSRTGPSAHGGIRLIERRPMPPLGHFSLIRFERLRARVGRNSRSRQTVICPRCKTRANKGACDGA